MIKMAILISVMEKGIERKNEHDRSIERTKKKKKTSFVQLWESKDEIYSVKREGGREKNSFIHQINKVMRCWFFNNKKRYYEFSFSGYI